MKVFLAAQTLSRSVTVALRTLRDLGYTEFKHCEATAEIIEVVLYANMVMIKTLSFNANICF